MRQYIYKSIRVLTLGVLFTSCKDNYLQVNPESSLSGETFYKTEAQFNQAVNGAYQPLQGLFTGQAWALMEMRSDNTTFQYHLDRSQSAREEIELFIESSNNPDITNFFQTSYAGIGRCNTILERIGPSSVSDAAKATVSGQASFLRAYYYYNLVRLFGQVPLVTKEVKSIAEAYRLSEKKATTEELYTSIIADAKVAVTNLPTTYPAAADKGRLTKYAAITLLADMYLTQKKYDLALEQLNGVIGKYSLVSSYANNYGLANENNAESIFEVQYIQDASLALYSNFQDTFAPWNSVGAVTVVPITGSGITTGWNIPTKDLIDSYEVGDQRRDASIGFNFTDPLTKQVIPYIRKYFSVHTIFGQYGNNFPVYRYPEVLLMSAECLNEKGYNSDPNALTYLNAVRTRAGLKARTAAELPSQDAFRQAVLQERRVELAFENKRWFDLLRTGTAEAVMKAEGTRQKTQFNTVPPQAYTSIRLQLLYPFRDTQLLESLVR